MFLSSLVVFIDTIGYVVVVPILPIYSSDLGVSDFQVGFLFATYAIAVVLSSIPLGVLADKWGRKPFVLFGMYAMAGAFIFYALANTYPVLAIARTLDRLTAAATWSAALALVGQRVEEDKTGSRMGFVMGAAAAGGIAGPVLGGVLYDLAGYAVPFYVIAGLCCLEGMLAVFLHEDMGRLKKSVAPAREMIKSVLSNRTILLACLVTLMTTMGFGLLEPTLPLHYTDTFNLSPVGIGLLFGVTSVFYAIGSPFSGKISDKYGRKDPMIIGLAITSVLIPLLVVFQDVFALFALIGVLGLTVALFEAPVLPLITDALAEASGGEVQRGGTAFGMMNLFWSLGYAMGPLLGGAIMGWMGIKPALGFYSILLLVTIGVVALFLKPPPLRQGANSVTQA